MPIKINFARVINLKKDNQQKIDSKTWIYSLIGIALAIVVSASLFAVNFYLQGQVSNAQKDQKKLAAQWDIQKSDEIAYLDYVGKVKILSDLFSSRQQKQAALKKFRSLFGEDASVVGLKYSVKTEEIEFQIKSSSVFSLDKVLNTLNSADLQQNYGVISKDRLFRDDQGQYVLAVRVSLATNKKDNK